MTRFLDLARCAGLAATLVAGGGASDSVIDVRHPPSINVHDKMVANRMVVAFDDVSRGSGCQYRQNRSRFREKVVRVERKN